MTLTLSELNELVYCVATAIKHGKSVNKPVAERLHKELLIELETRCKELDRLMQAETYAVSKWG